MSDLKGKTLFITGASRGIGLAIAKRAAADGANIAVAAKTADPHPKLEGTIFTAADEIEKSRFAALYITAGTLLVEGVKPQHGLVVRPLRQRFCGLCRLFEIFGLFGHEHCLPLLL